MMKSNCRFAAIFSLVLIVFGSRGIALAQDQLPIGGFLPFVGMALTDEFENLNTSATFFLTEVADSPGGNFLGQGASAFYDIALLDTGAATHIIAPGGVSGFDLAGEGFAGTNIQVVGGATGTVIMTINNPHGVYVAGMGDRTSAGNSLTMDNSALRGQTSFAALAAPQEWTLPSIVGLPMAAQHTITIRNDDPQIFTLDGRTVRTPNVTLSELGTGDQQGITRRMPLTLKPGLSFVSGPLYVYTIDPFTLSIDVVSPSIVENGALMIDVDTARSGLAMDDSEFLFDTGADLTVISEQMAVRLGFDPVLDTPDFVVPVEGSGGITEGIPGIYLDELKLDTIGGSFSVQNVPVAILDVTNPSDPGNVIDGILGTHVFNGRNLSIDANPSTGGAGPAPSLYISDPVTTPHAWGTTAASGSWATAGNWNANGVPSPLWDATVANVRGSDQEAVLSTNSTIFRTTVSGDPGAEMSVRVQANSQLTVFQDVIIKDHGRLNLDEGKVDAQFIQLDGGRLTGTGDIFVGSGPLTGAVRNRAGRIEPGDVSGSGIGLIDIVGDLSNNGGGTLAFDLAGTGAADHDRISVDRFIFLAGTLEVSLDNAYTPNIGDSFTLMTAGEGVSGTFDTLSLPSGFQWNVAYNANSVVLQVTGAGLAGDFNGDGVLGCPDIDALVLAVYNQSTSSTFDVNGDGQVNVQDVNHWVTVLRGTIMGDANLDGAVDGADFILWNDHKFTSATAWCAGDFNADGAVDGQDFFMWNDNKFTSADGVAIVPEPASGLLLLGACLAGWPRRRGRNQL